MEINLSELIFLDIETVCCVPTYSDLNPRLQEHWNKKSSYIDRDIDPADLFFSKAGIYAEFGKIVVISIGRFFINQDKELSFKTKTLSGHDEHTLLSEFKSIIEKYPANKISLVAHNGIEFDFPYLCRRMLINGIKTPEVLNLSGKKPWEVKHIDTLNFWKFGDKKNYTSLDLLAAIFDLPGSKDDIDGSMVSEVYYHQNNLERIASYCSKDVWVTAMLYLKLHQISLPKTENIVFY
jgi:predicted PolB exonuclease-like 3'-5' exonuclease